MTTISVLAKLSSLITGAEKRRCASSSITKPSGAKLRDYTPDIIAMRVTGEPQVWGIKLLCQDDHPIDADALVRWSDGALKVADVVVPVTGAVDIIGIYLHVFNDYWMALSTTQNFTHYYVLGDQLVLRIGDLRYENL